MTSRWFEQPELRFAVGVEDTFVPQAFPGRRALDEYELTQHYARWHSDLGLAKECGATMIRYGIPWHIVNPAPQSWEWDWLDGVVQRLVELELEPIVDLMHYGTPLWLDNQFLNADYPARVAEYAAQVADRYRDSLQIYTPLNEPLINAMFCGEWGIWPPHLNGHDGFVKLIRAIARGIVTSQSAIAELSADASFVHVEAAFRYVGAIESDEAQLLLERRFLAEDLVTGRIDEHHPLAEYLAKHGFSDADLAWCQEHTAGPDVMGVNYYPTLSTELFPADRRHHGAPWDPRPRPDEGVTGLEDVVRIWGERYDAPVFLTETCRPGDVAGRLAWLDASVDCIHRLRGDGVDVIGYTWWPLFDMVDWRYREEAGPVAEFLMGSGLWALEADPLGLLQTTATPLVERFRAHATSPRLDPSAPRGSRAIGLPIVTAHSYDSSDE